MNLKAGALISNRFRLLDRLHVGALGTMWRAADRIPGREVAIRIVESRACAEAIESFEREATLAKTVRHRAATAVYDAGRTADGTGWVAYEFVEGERLDSLLEHGPLSATSALPFIADLAAALAELHALGIAHGAVSARAVIVQALQPKLIGLGRARLIGAKQMAARAHRLPEARYFSPEVIASRGYDAASDVWSLGALLYQCVTGRFPFSARTSLSFQSELRCVERVLSSVEEERVRGIIADCFAVDPAARPSAVDVATRVQLVARESRPQQIAAISIEPVEWVHEVSAPGIEVAQSPPAEVDAARRDLSPPAIEPPAPSEDLNEDLVEPLVIDFRPRRPRATFVIAGMAAAATIVTLIVATREPPAARRVVQVATAVATTTLEPTATTTAEPTAAIAPPLAPTSVTAVTATSAPPTPPAAPTQTALAKPTAAPPVAEDNPYE
jgi:serine/threonine protein kinase